MYHQQPPATREAACLYQSNVDGDGFVMNLAFSTVNDALGVPPDWQVAEAAPPAVRAAVTFGREPAARDAR